MDNRKKSTALLLAIVLLALQVGVTFAQGDPPAEPVTVPIFADEPELAFHFWPIIPSCVSPPHSKAIAMFDTGMGPVEVQFHGTSVWVGEEYCPSQRCTWIADAGMLPGDEIWAYSVWAIYSAHRSAWCAGIAKAGQQVNQGNQRVDLVLVEMMP
jgi:hypothetical protein